jgi:hypothetical protein
MKITLAPNESMQPARRSCSAVQQQQLQLDLLPGGLHLARRYAFIVFLRAIFIY